MTTQDRDLFVTAYCWMFGCSKRKAQEVFRDSSPEFIAQICYAFRRNAQEGFYHD